MSERKHNWELDGLAITAGTDNICYMGVPAQYAGDISEMCPNWEANARLIASSPDLKDVVLAQQELIAKAQSILTLYLVPTSNGTDTPDDAINSLLTLLDGPAYREVKTKFDAAISKATGGAG